MGKILRYKHGEDSVDKVDPRLWEIVQAAVAVSQYDAVIRSGAEKRSSNGGNHNPGWAVDVTLIDRQTGEALPDYQNGKSFAAYEQYAQSARVYQQEHYPELNKDFRWGGYFGSKKGTDGYGAVDLMHLDINPNMKGATSLGNWDKGASQTLLDAYPGAETNGGFKGGSGDRILKQYKGAFENVGTFLPPAGMGSDAPTPMPARSFGNDAFTPTMPMQTPPAIAATRAPAVPPMAMPAPGGAVTSAPPNPGRPAFDETFGAAAGDMESPLTRLATTQLGWEGDQASWNGTDIRAPIPPASTARTRLEAGNVDGGAADARMAALAQPSVPALGKSVTQIGQEADNGRLNGYREIQEMGPSSKGAKPNTPDLVETLRKRAEKAQPPEPVLPPGDLEPTGETLPGATNFDGSPVPVLAPKVAQSAPTPHPRPNASSPTVAPEMPADKMVKLPTGKMAKVGTYKNPETGNVITVTDLGEGKGKVDIARTGFVDLGSEMNADTLLGGIIRSKISEAVPAGLESAATAMAPAVEGVQNAATQAIDTVAPAVDGLKDAVGNGFSGLMSMFGGGPSAAPAAIRAPGLQEQMTEQAGMRARARPAGPAVRAPAPPGPMPGRPAQLSGRPPASPVRAPAVEPSRRSPASDDSPQVFVNSRGQEVQATVVDRYNPDTNKFEQAVVYR